MTAKCNIPRMKGGQVRCELPKGHDGPHFAHIHHTTTWPRQKPQHHD